PRCWLQAARLTRSFWETVPERSWRAARILLDACFRCRWARNRSRKTLVPDVRRQEPSALSAAPTLDDREAICALPAIEGGARRFFEKDAASRGHGPVVKGHLEFQVKVAHLKGVALRAVLAILHSLSIRL